MTTLTQERQGLDLQSILIKLGKGSRFTAIADHKYPQKDAAKARAVLDRLVAAVDINDIASIKEVIPQMNEL